MLRLARRSLSIIERCPPPSYDTGCTHCEIPAFPAGKQIDFAANLNSTKVLPWKHVLIMSHGVENFDDMPSKIEHVPGLLALEISRYKRGLLSPFHPILVSNASINRKIDAGNKQVVFLFPDAVKVEFDMKHTKQFILEYLTPKELVATRIFNPFKKSTETTTKKLETNKSMFNETPLEKDIVLLCGHTQRDIRCGELAPLIEQELVKVLEKEKLDIDVGLVSHIGGHAYAGNLIYFPKDTSKSIVWYGRVFPSLVQGIVQETIVKGNIIKELYRGDLKK